MHKSVMTALGYWVTRQRSLQRRRMLLTIRWKRRDPTAISFIAAKSRIFCWKSSSSRGTKLLWYSALVLGKKLSTAKF